MSLYATLDEEIGSEVASNRGWGDFGRWADSLDAEKYIEIVRLWEYGLSQDVKGLADQLATAIKDESPVPDVQSVAENILELANGTDAEVFGISDGFGPDDKEEAEQETKSLKEVAHAPAGSPQGGQFISGGGSGGGAVATAMNLLEAPVKLEHAIGHAVKAGAKEFGNYVNDIWTGGGGEIGKQATEAVLATVGTKSKITTGLSMIASGGMKAYFSAWVLGNKAVEGIARAKEFVKGLSESEVKRVSSICSSYDVLACKPIFLGLEHAGMPHLASASLFVPAASVAYIAYSTATNPIAVAKAAKNAVKSFAGLFKKKTIDADEVKTSVEQLCDAAKAHAGDDWYFALLPHAIEYSGEHVGDILDAIALAESAAKQHPEPKE